MIRAGLSDSKSRNDQTESVRDGSLACCLAYQANAGLPLNDGLVPEATVTVLFIDADTMWIWYPSHQEDGIKGLASLGRECDSQRLMTKQQGKPKVWITAVPPHTTREMGVWVARECGIEHQNRPRLITVLHRLDMPHLDPIERLWDLMHRHSVHNKYCAKVKDLSMPDAKLFVQRRAKELAYVVESLRISVS